MEMQSKHFCGYHSVLVNLEQNFLVWNTTAPLQAPSQHFHGLLLNKATAKGTQAPKENLLERQRSKQR